MNFLIVGLGSMGKRRIRCLLAMGIPTEAILGFDPRYDRIKEARTLYSIQTFQEFSKIDLSLTHVWVISTPPDLHMDYAIIGAQLNKHLFIEASVVNDDMDRLQKILAKNNLIVFPSCTMRFFPGPNKINEILNQKILGKIYAWQYQSGQYLPDWHPWEDIQDFYVSQKETGGCREIVPFELSWLTWIFGPIKNLKSHQSRVGNLPASIDDIYLLQVQHASDIFGQLLVDVLSRTPIRYLRMTAENGTLIWDDSAHQISLHIVGDTKMSPSASWQTIPLPHGTTEKYYINPEEPYQNEIKNFLTCIENKKNPDYTLKHDQEILNLLYSAEKNAQQIINV